MDHKRGSFSGKIGFVLSAAGASVGLGNIWRFPYLAAKYGGAIFLLVYIILAMTFGYTMIIAETSIGRMTGKSPVGAYKSFSDKPALRVGGWINAIIPILIVPYYSVIGGWVIKYLAEYLMGKAHLVAEDGYFSSFISNGVSSELCFLVFTAMTLAIIFAGVENGIDEQVLLGVTGSGKTYTMAKVIERVQRPTLVLAHNKILAAQLCSEFKEFFPNNAVEYFVSYYDYYQPEAYIPHTDTFIEKDASINDEIERLRHSATSSLFERRDVIVVSSVSCIYGLGDPIDYANMVISLRTGQQRDPEELMRKLIDIRYERNDIAFARNMFRVRGDTIDIFPAYSSDHAVRVELSLIHI